MAKVAYCRRCNEPLVMTYAWPGFEFYCVNCGAKYGWTEPRAVDATPERLARMQDVKTEWATLADGLLGVGVLLTGCQQCAVGFTPDHWAHASEEEKEAHDAAMTRINLRAAAWVPPAHHGWHGEPHPA